MGAATPTSDGPAQATFLVQKGSKFLLSVLFYVIFCLRAPVVLFMVPHLSPFGGQFTRIAVRNLTIRARTFSQKPDKWRMRGFT